MDPDMLAKAIVEHYYSTFDTNQSSLANLHQEVPPLHFHHQLPALRHQRQHACLCQRQPPTRWRTTHPQVQRATSVNFSLAQLIQVIILLCTSGKNGGGYEASKYEVIAFNGGIMFLHGRINSVPISVISFLRQLGVIWNVLGVFVLMILIPSVATKRASLKFAFTHFNTKNEDGIKSKPNIFLLGLLMSQYTLIGYDASAHMTEETKGADRNRPKGIASEVGIFIIVGWGYILGISFAVTNIPYFLRESNDAGRYAIGEMFYLAF
ncbi:Putative amino-acid permease C74.04 [Glycine soja]|nr:Putative amino-acid permease C74.04 [Glycine soja]